MKAILEFCPVENKFELEAAIKATDMWLVLKNALEVLKTDLRAFEDRGMEEDVKALKRFQNNLLEEISNQGLDNLIYNY